MRRAPGTEQCARHAAGIERLSREINAGSRIRPSSAADRFGVRRSCSRPRSSARTLSRDRSGATSARRTWRSERAHSLNWTSRADTGSAILARCGLRARRIRKSDLEGHARGVHVAQPAATMVLMSAWLTYRPPPWSECQARFDLIAEDAREGAAIDRALLADKPPVDTARISCPGRVTWPISSHPRWWCRRRSSRPGRCSRDRLVAHQWRRAPR